MDYRELIDGLDLRAILAPQRSVSGVKPVMLRCFWHGDHHFSLAVYKDHLHCFGCGVHKGVLDYLAELDHLDIKGDFAGTVRILAEKYGTGFKIPVPVHQAPVQKEQLPMDAGVAKLYHDRLGEKRAWFRNRGLTDRIIDAQLLGYDGRAFTIPVWHPSGELLTIRYRRDDMLGDSGPKYWGVQGRNETLLYNEGALAAARSVVICEGELDCLRLWQEGIPAVSSTNGVNGMITIWDRVNHLFCSRIVIAFDQDDAGRAGARELQKKINGSSYRSVSWERSRILRWNKRLGKDITDLALNKGTDYVIQLIREVVNV